MNKMISHIADFCYIIMEILLMSAVYLLAQAIVNTGHTMNYTGILFICLVALCDYFLKIKSANYIFFLIGHLVFIPIILYLNFTDIEKIALIILIVLLLIGSISFWQAEVNLLKKRTLDMSLISVFPFVIIEIICYFIRSDRLLHITTAMGVVFLLLYFIRFYLANLQQFINSNTGSKSTPFHKVFLMNSGYNIIILLAACFLFLLVNMMNIGKSLGFLGKGIKYILMAVMSYFGGENQTDFKLPDNMDTLDTSAFDLVGHDVKPNLILIFILRILSYAALTAFIIFILYTIYRGFKFYMKRYVSKTDIIEFTEPIDLNPKKKERGTRKSVLSIFTGKTNNQKIRKIYYNKVRYFQKCLVDVHDHDTTGEINNRIRSKTGISVNKLTNLYEQARYGEKELNREDVEIAKKAKD